MIWIRLLPYAIGVIAISGVLYGVHQHGYNKHRIESQLEQAENDRMAAEKLRKLEGEKNANMAEVERLRANNHALWLRLPSTSCSGENATPGSGELPEVTPSSAEQALNEFANHCGEQAYQCDSIVESCRVLNDALP